MKIEDRVTLPNGTEAVVRSEEQNGRVFAKTDSGNTGWYEVEALVPVAAKTWPPETEVK